MTATEALEFGVKALAEERDEARAELAKLRAQYEERVRECIEFVAIRDRLLKENDELREQLAEARGNGGD